MSRLIAITAAAALATTAYAHASFAQNAPPANPNVATPAIHTSSTPNPGAPAAGANSFTEAQAKSRIEAAGFSNVSNLAKDKDGVWRGKATKAGATVSVAVDFQGNVVTN